MTRPRFGLRTLGMGEFCSIFLPSDLSIRLKYEVTLYNAHRSNAYRRSLAFVQEAEQ